MSVCENSKSNESLAAAIVWQLHVFLVSKAFFQLSISVTWTFSWIKLQMLLRCCLIHVSIVIMRHFLYLLYLCPCLSMSRPRSFPIAFMWSIFHFHLHFHYNLSYNLMNTDALVLLLVLFTLLLIFQYMSYYSWMITRMKNAKNLQISQVQPQNVASHFLYFLPISA